MSTMILYHELLLFALLVGGFCRLLYLKTKIPYPVLILIAGFILGTIDSFVVNHFLNTLVKGWVGMRPKLLLCVFMPSIVFESAVFSNYRIVANSLTQILYIAVPATAVSILATILYAYLVFPYKWTWNEFSLLGTIVWAIEPTPMLQILEEIGVAKELNHLIETASLWSDGTILSSFSISNRLAATDTTLSFDAVVMFIRQIGGGFLLGYVFAKLFIQFCQSHKDDLTNVIVSIVVVYLTFYIAEVTPVHVSGVVGVMVIGHQLSSYDIMKQSQSSLLLHTWRLLGYICNTLVLFLCGLIVAEEALFKNPHPINFQDIGHLIAFYIATNVLRLIILAASYPILKFLKYNFAFKSLLVIVWSDLRGSVAIVLTMLILDDNSRMTDNVFYRILFYSCGMVVLTTIVNCFTMKYLISFLRIVEEKPFSYSIYSSCQQLLSNYTNEEMNHLKKSHYLIHANWEKVASMLPKIAPRKITSTTNEQYHEADFLNTLDVDNYQTIEEKEDTIESRKRYLILLQSKYWELYHYRSISKGSLFILLTGIYKSLDSISRPLDQWDYYEERLTSASCFHQIFKNNKIYHKLFRSAYFNKTLQSWEVAVTFLLAHKQVRKPYKAMVTSADTILSETTHDAIAAMKYINILIKSNKELMETIHTFRALEILLRSNELLIKKLLKKGALDDKNVQKLQEAYSVLMVHIKEDFYNTKLLAINDLFFNRTIFVKLRDDFKQPLLKKASLLYYLPNSYVYEQDDINTNLYILVEGLIEIEFNVTNEGVEDDFEVVQDDENNKKKKKKNKKKKDKILEDSEDENISEVENQNELTDDENDPKDHFNLKLLNLNDDDKLFDKYLGAGTILGGLSMMTNLTKQYSAKVITRCCCFKISQSDIIEIFHKDPHFESEFCKHLIYSEARFFDSLITLPETELSDIMDKAVLHKPNLNETFSYSDYCVLISGSMIPVDDSDNQDIIEAFFSFWGSDFPKNIAGENCRILEIPLPNQKPKPKRLGSQDFEWSSSDDSPFTSDVSDFTVQHELFPFDNKHTKQYIAVPTPLTARRSNIQRSSQYSSDDLDINKLRPERTPRKTSVHNDELFVNSNNKHKHRSSIAYSVNNRHARLSLINKITSRHSAIKSNKNRSSNINNKNKNNTPAHTNNNNNNNNNNSKTSSTNKNNSTNNSGNNNNNNNSNNNSNNSSNSSETLPPTNPQRRARDRTPSVIYIDSLSNF